MPARGPGQRNEPGDRPAGGVLAPGARVGFLWNPRAGSAGNPGRRRRIRRALDDAGLEIRETPTEAPGQAESLAREHAAAGTAAVFCWGGDGTLAEAARGLLDTETALAPLPGGTMNVLGRELGLPRRPERAVGALLAGRFVTVRPGSVRAVRQPGNAGAAVAARAVGDEERAERPFLSMCSVGLDASVARRVAERERRRRGLAPWVAAGLGVFLTAPLPRLRVRVRPATGGPENTGGTPGNAPEDLSLTACWVGVGTHPRYARFLRLFPGARFGEPRFTATVVRWRTRFAAPLMAAASLAGLLRRLPGVRLLRASAVFVESNDAAADSQTDGDPFTSGPVEIGLGAKPLRLLIPTP